jgi:hypothetical protein
MKTPVKLLMPAAFTLAFLSLYLTACQKGVATEPDTQQVTLYLTDGPADYKAVNVDIQYVEVKVDTNSRRRHDDHACDNDSHADDDRRGRDEFGKWDTLAVDAGVYDVASLRNGIDTELASGTVNGRVRKIRLTLGSQNTLTTTDGITHDLLLWPGTNNYLYVMLHDEHRQPTNNNGLAIWVDFDISRSIVEANGKYYLKPVLKPFCDKNFGIVEGKVLPADAKPIVSVYNSNDAGMAIPRPDGSFKIRGLKPGTYTVELKPTAGNYKTTTLSNVQVVAGKPTRLGETTLTQ